MQTSRQEDKRTAKQADGHIKKHAGCWSFRQVGRQTGTYRETNKRKGRFINKQAGRQMDRQPYKQRSTKGTCIYVAVTILKLNNVIYLNYCQILHSVVQSVCDILCDTHTHTHTHTHACTHTNNYTSFNAGSNSDLPSAHVCTWFIYMFK